MASIVTNPTAWILTLLTVMFTLTGCSKPTVIDGEIPVEISGSTFMLEIVADDESRNLGLGGRKSLDPDKGMLFVFPKSELRKFLMRDCYIDIDIIFLDATGRITAMHHMPIEEQKNPEESAYQYDLRLKKYSSRFNAQYAIELIGGTLESLNLEDGQQIKLDTVYLQSVAQ